MIKVLEKVDDILKEISLEGEATFSFLKSKTGMAKSTLSQILKSMLQLGWICRTENGAFLPGERLAGYAGKTSGGESLERSLSEAVRLLAETTGETASASIIVGSRRVRAARTYGKGEIMVDDEKAARGRGGFFSTATGRLLAAFQQEDKRACLIKSDGLQNTPRMTAELDRIKERGFAIHKSPGGGAVSIACGIFRAAGKIAAAIGVAVPAYNLTREKQKFYIAKTKEAARFAERMLN